MGDLATFFQRHQRLTLLLAALILVAGFSAILTMPQDEDPRITNRYPLILTAYPGAGAERVDSLVTEKIEEELRKIPEIIELRSTSRNGLSSIAVELDGSIEDIAGPFSEIRDALDDAAQNLPEGALDPVFNDDRTYAYTKITALKWVGTGQADFNAMRRFADELQRRMQSLDGAELVTLHGAPSEEYRVTIPAARAVELGLDHPGLAAALARADAKTAAATLTGAESRLVVEVTGEIDGLTRLRNLPVALGPGGETIRLGEIAEISRGVVKPLDRLAIARGAEAILVATRMAEGTRAGAWSDSYTAELDEFRRLLPQEIEAQVIFDQVFYIQDRLATLLTNLGLGMALVVAVLFLTLGPRAALVVTLAIPLSALSALAVLNAAAIPIHQMSVTGLIVALGLLVDAAIVMVDALQRRLDAGLKLIEAIRGSVKRLAVPLLASTLTTVLGFAPIMLAEGGVSEFVGPIAISVNAALIASFLIALTILPVLAGKILRARPDSHGRGLLPGQARIASLFDRSLRWSLARPATSVVLAALLPAIGLFGATQLRQQFFPEADRNQIMIEVHMPSTAGIGATRAVVEGIRQRLDDEPDVQHADWTLGESAPKFYYNVAMNQDANPAFAAGQVTTRNLAVTGPLVVRLQEEFDAAFPEAQILVIEINQGPPTFAPVELRFSGPNANTLRELGEDARRLLASIPEVTHSFASMPGGEPRLKLRLDEEAALAAGWRPNAIAGQLGAAINGMPGGTVLEGMEEIPVRLQIAPEDRADPATLAAFNLQALAANGGRPALPLDAVSTLDVVPAPGTLTRYQGRRTNLIAAYVRADSLPSDAVTRFEELWAEAGPELPPGYTLTVGGDDEARGEAIADIAATAGLVAVLMTATIVLTFNSFSLSLIVAGVAGMAAGLGLLSLWVLAYPFGFQPIIALLGLIGVAINAAIIIITSLQADEDASQGDEDAIRRRVKEASRHIISTTLTTFAGFLPLLLGSGKFWPPFAAAIAGGVLMSTILSFYFVPAAYRLMVGRRAAAPAPAPA